MECIKEYISPELLVLVPVLYLVGRGLKCSKVRDERIPLLLGAAGVLLAALWVFATAELASWRDLLLTLFTAGVQGALCAGASVYCDQLVKQARKKR